MVRCVEDISSWTSSNRLKVNPQKRESMCSSTSGMRHHLNTTPLHVGAVSINAQTSVHLLGVTLDSDFSMSTHVIGMISRCFYQLRRLKYIWRSLTIEATKALVSELVLHDVTTTMVCLWESPWNSLVDFSAFLMQLQDWSTEVQACVDQSCCCIKNAAGAHGGLSSCGWHTSLSSLWHYDYQPWRYICCCSPCRLGNGIGYWNQTSKYEFMCVLVVFGPSSCIVAIIYRPGSLQVSKPVFEDLADVLDRLFTFVDPIFFVGDVNFRLYWPADPTLCGFNDILEVHGLQNCVMRSNHDLGELFDVVVRQKDLTVGLLAHHLLRLRACLNWPCPVYNSVTSRSWGRLDSVAFRAVLSASALCSTDQWSEINGYPFMTLHNYITMKSLCTVSCWRHPSAAVPSGCKFYDIRPLTVDVITAAVQSLPNK